MRFSRADRGRGRWCRRKYSFLRRRWRRLLERLSEADGDVGRRKRGFLFDALGELLRCCVGGLGAREEGLSDVCGWRGRRCHCVGNWPFGQGVRGVWNSRALEVGVSELKLELKFGKIV